MFLSENEQHRYTRHFLLPEIGCEGQERLKAARILLIGLGGLGSPAALYLAAAGVGKLGLLDADTVDLSNLQRQILYSTEDVGRLKVEIARDKIQALNPHVDCIALGEKFSEQNAEALLEDYDIVIDGTDNFTAHYLINDACVLFNKPLVAASVLKFEGQLTTIIPHKGPCYRCLYPNPPSQGSIPSCADIGVLGSVPGMLGVMQANEAMKLILSIGKSLQGRILLCNLLRGEFRTIRLEKHKHCPLCGEHPIITQLTSLPETVCAFQHEVSAEDLKQLFQRPQPPTLLDVRTEEEYIARHIEGAILIPVSEIEERWQELNMENEIVVYCQSGKRSAHAISLLRSKGFLHLYNLSGGIMSFS